MKDLKITNKEYDVKDGFMFVDYDNGLLIQCCLQYIGGERVFVEYDNGYDWGLWADVNRWAFDKYGKETVLLALTEAAKELGLTIYYDN